MAKFKLMEKRSKFISYYELINIALDIFHTYGYKWAWNRVYAGFIIVCNTGCHGNRNNKFHEISPFSPDILAQMHDNFLFYYISIYSARRIHICSI